MFPKPFKKLHPEILEKLTFLKITDPTPLQSQSIPVIKSGSNLNRFAKRNIYPNYTYRKSKRTLEEA